MEFNNTMPIYLQVINDVKKNLISGNLKLGQKMPSARELALHYQINPNTCNRIYKELEGLELCYTKRGLGTFVTEDEERIAKIRSETASSVLMGFLTEMRGLGFSEEEIVNEVITTIKDQEQKGE